MALSLLEQISLFIRPKTRFKSKDRHIEIIDHIENGRAARLLLYDGIRESGMYLDDYGDVDPLFHYMKIIKIMLEHYPGLDNMLLIGGGGFVLPKIYLKGKPNRKVTVVEVDAGYVELAKKYFYLNTADPRLKIIINDGYKYLTEYQDLEKFDIIVYDAYTGDNLAKSILSEMVCRKIHSMLNPGGIYALNMINEAQDIISMQTRLTESVLKTVFNNTRITQCPGGGNCILMASDSRL